MRFLRFCAGLFIYGITAAAIFMAVFAAYVGFTYEKKGTFNEAVLIEIPRGANIRSISEILLYNGVLESYNDALLFHISARISGDASKVKAGEYEIPPHATMGEVMKLLIEGKTFTRQITIREGLTNYEILALLNANNDLKKTKIEMLGEGRYLPETYSYALSDSNADIINRMAMAMDKILNEAWEKRADNLPIKTKEEALILASIIEKETAVPSERKRVAGVFINRLRKGMLLQTDPTVIYALTKGKHENGGQGPLGRRLLKKDLKYDSPYNTYKYAGLPPAPICNPGKASIEAALNPEKHKYIYFVADGSGGHAFAKTLSEHNSNVAKWRKIRRGK